MKTIFAILICSTCALASCENFKQAVNSEQTKAELKAIGGEIIDAATIAAAESALAAAREKLAEVEAEPLPPDAGTFESLSRTLAITTARSFVNLAQRRVDALKAKRQPGKNPVNVNAVVRSNTGARYAYRREGRTRGAEIGLA